MNILIVNINFLYILISFNINLYLSIKTKGNKKNILLIVYKK